MMRSIDYRVAATAFFFAGCWFVFGVLVLWTPIPRALGIHHTMLVGWLLLFFAILGLSGATLVAAAWNAIFPPSVSPPRRAQSLWSASGQATREGRPPAGARPSGTQRG